MRTTATAGCQMRPVSGLDALPYSLRGMRPARNARRPASVASFMAVAIATGSCAPLMAVLTSRPDTPSSMQTAQSLAVGEQRLLVAQHFELHERRGSADLQLARESERANRFVGGEATGGVREQHALLGDPVEERLLALRLQVEPAHGDGDHLRAGGD